MGWSIGYDRKFMRFIGYSVPGLCDHPECNEKIDRGVDFTCGGSRSEWDENSGCGLHFCEEHGGGGLCERCEEGQESFEPKPDCDEWVEWTATDESWEEWRDENNAHTIEEIRALEKRQKIENGLWKVEAVS